MISKSNPGTKSEHAVPNGVLDVFGPQIQHLTALSDADGDYCLMKSLVPAGAAVPIHSHADRETFCILGGELQALWEDRWSTVVAGDVFDIPGGIRHAWRNVSGAPASALVLTTMKLGRFFRDIGRPLGTFSPGPPPPAELQRFVELSHNYGYWLGSPADNAAVSISLG